MQYSRFTVHYDKILNDYNFVYLRVFTEVILIASDFTTPYYPFFIFPIVYYSDRSVQLSFCFLHFRLICHFEKKIVVTLYKNHTIYSLFLAQAHTHISLYPQLTFYFKFKTLAFVTTQTAVQQHFN